MEQILAFVLGVGIVISLGMVIVMFKTKKLAEQNETSIRNIEEWVSRNDELVNRRIDEEINRTNELYNDSIRHTDSRVDKLDSKFCSDGKALTEKSKKFLKG